MIFFKKFEQQQTKDDDKYEKFSFKEMKSFFFLFFGNCRVGEEKMIEIK